jgi:RNA polymerase sigma factor (sigma-70 family)
MAQVHPVLRFLRQLAAPAGDLADEQLLERFLTEGSEAAFAALVRRHGPMVLGVCRRVLPNHQDAEDAFQTTFLVLVRKAGSLRQRELLGNWLHGVAYRTARKARAQAARRRAGEQPLPDVGLAQAGHDPARHELRVLIEEEVQRLPARYRVPVVLCYLQGKTNQEAARQLQWPLGSVKGRLTRARELLRRRLASRGVTLSALALGGILAENVSAAVSAALAQATIRAGLLTAARQAVAAGAGSSPVIHLLEGVLKAMALCNLKVVAGLLLVFALALTGVGWFGDGTRGAGAGAARGGGRKAADKPRAPRKKVRVESDKADAEYELAILKERSANNLKLLGLAMHRYHKAHGKLPPAVLFSKEGKPLHSWRVLLLPHLGQKALAGQFKLDEPWDSDHNQKLLARMPEVYAPVRNPPKKPFATYYQVLTGDGTAFDGKKGLRIPRDFPDGTSNTILIVEAWEAVPWTRPVDVPYDAKKPLPKLGGLFKEGFNVTLVDGSARFVKRSISNQTLRHAITRNDGEVPGADW